VSSKVISRGQRADRQPNSAPLKERIENHRGTEENEGVPISSFCLAFAGYGEGSSAILLVSFLHSPATSGGQIRFSHRPCDRISCKFFTFFVSAICGWQFFILYNLFDLRLFRFFSFVCSCHSRARLRPRGALSFFSAIIFACLPPIAVIETSEALLL
jgi:hypothetical protein